MVRRILLALLRVADLILLPFTLAATLLLKAIRRAGVERMPASRSAFLRLGLLPIRRHYYEPYSHPDDLRRARDSERSLPALQWNEAAQFDLLSRFDTVEELRSIPRSPSDAADHFYFDNGWYGRGDAEYLYSLIRLVKPARIIEVGVGFSTRVVRLAIARNRQDSGAACSHLCIEPYARPGLASAGIEVLRQRVEDVSPALFSTLGANDILFIDSSHVVRPQGDVVVNLLEILPRLPPGVFVHFHDIFTPRDYPAELVERKLLLWTEQYALEAFLSFNHEFEIMGALNWLAHHHPDRLAARFPAYAEAAGQCRPSSFWIRRRSH